MGSPITFSGFNGVDFSMVLNAVMAQEQQPLKALQTQKSTLDSQNTIFGTLASKLGTLRSAADDLGRLDSLARLTATSSDAAVGVATTAGTVPGSYDVVVSELARRQVTASSTTYGSLDDIVGTSGSLAFTPPSEEIVMVTITGSTTVKDLIRQVNAATESPVTASAVQTSTGVYQLVLSGRNSGTANAFTVGSTLAGGTGPVFTDTDGDGVSGDTAADNAQQATNAAFTVNNLAITSASNTVTDVIPGVTLTLAQKDPAKTVTVDVSRDTEAATTAVQSFIDAYNGVMTFMQDQATAASSGKTNISRDPMLRGLRNEVRNLMQQTFGAGTFTNLPSAGIGFDTKGKMTLDAARFQDAMNTTPTEVQTLFSGAGGGAGAFGALSSLVDGYTRSGGLVATMRNRLTAQATTLSSRMDDLQGRLDLRRQSLQAQFIAADMAMAQLRSQGDSLSQLGGQYRLF